MVVPLDEARPAPAVAHSDLRRQHTTLEMIAMENTDPATGDPR
ncbi:protein of unknown function [Modestobacter italicus]|uniref:Uncharacterized protein n=1 Tax=Modestobacter italicus (strain DSM 44449 / CECT 9708 / BC 501) TaxID=2732864 RepID=I4EY56_MODI5|nr:hypothetical protein [Modestobacter marinus]CCH88319.1 protein of unknown function [Modestobacter marinus]